MAADPTQIVDLTTDMTGQDFIDQLNANLSLAAQSGGNRDSTEQEQLPGIEKTIHLLMQYGGLALLNYGNYDTYTNVKRKGYIVRYTHSETASFRNSCHTILMIGIENCTVTDIKIEGNEELRVFYYDSNFEYKGHKSGTNVLTILNYVKDLPKEDRCYIKIVLHKDTGYPILRNLEVTVEGEYTLVKNKTPLTGCVHWFSFATGYPSKAETETTANGSYLGTVSSEGKNSDIACFDNGYIVLPPNYSQEGVPVPLIIYCHGTGGFGFDLTTIISEKMGRIRKFLANNGYAVCDCSHLTSIYTTNIGDSRFLPSLVSTMANLIEFIQMNYNVETDGIYIAGKSAGGYACLLLPLIEGFRVKAAAGLSPTTFTFMLLYPGARLVSSEATYTAHRNALLEQHDITEIENTEDMETTGIGNVHSYNAYLNVSKLRRYDPLFKSTNITTEELQTFIRCYYKSEIKYLHTFIEAAKTAAGNPNGNANISQEDGRYIVNIVNKIKITIDCPIKIWQSVNDASVSCDMSELFIEWCKRGGSPAYFRKLKSNGHLSGGSDKDPRVIEAHNLVDEINEDGSLINTIETTYHTKYGGDAVETVAICEMVDWFNQW